MKKTFLSALLACGFLSAMAFHIEYGANVNISKPVNGNLYIAGGTVTINAPVHGDLIIAGGTIIINDTVTNDILLAGGNVTFNGFVGDDIRCAGGNLRITKNVTGDLVVTAGEVIVEKGVTLGNLLVGGGDVTLDGNVNGEVRGVFGNFSLNGNVAKNIDCRGGKITVNGNIGGSSVLAARTIVVGSGAAFYGDVRFWNRKGSMDFGLSLKNAKASYDPSLRMQASEWYYLGASTLVGLLWYLGMVLVMLFIVQYLFSATLRKAADAVFNNSLKSLGTGFLFFIAVPVAALAAFITLVGIPVGLLLILFYVIVLLLSTLTVSLVTANWFRNRFKPNWSYPYIVMAAFGIFIVLKLVSATPLVGWLIICLMSCMAFGGVLLNVRWKGRTVSPGAQQNT